MKQLFLRRCLLPRWLDEGGCRFGLPSLKDYIRSVALRTGRFPVRAAITDGNWLVVFKRPDDAFDDGEQQNPKFIHVFASSDEIIERYDRPSYASAADYCMSIHTGHKEYLLRESMKELASTLDPKKFVRIHRSVIVNLNCIREVIREGRGEGTAILANGRRLRMSDSGWKGVFGICGPCIRWRAG